MKAEVLQEGEILGGVSTREVEWIELVYYKLDNTRESIRLNQEINYKSICGGYICTTL